MSNVQPANSRILHGSSPHVPADGTHQAVVKVRLRDHNDQPVAGRQAQLSASRAGVTIQQPGLTDEHGLALGYVTADTVGPVNITAVVLPVSP